jgi:hypothetical protein
MKTIYVVSSLYVFDSAWWDKGKADARAKDVDMIALPCPVPEDGDVLPRREKVYMGRPPGYNGGPPGRDVDR